MVTTAQHSISGDSAHETAPIIRRVRPSDSDQLTRFYGALSPESRRARFLGYVKGVSPELSRSFCTPDHMHGEGFVALLPAAGGGEGELIGHLCLEPLDARQIELAVAVADAHQGRGVGRALFEAAIDWASRHGVEEIVASAFADNSRVLRLLSSAPHAARIKPADGGLVDVVVPLVAELPPDEYVPAPAGSRRLRRLAARVRPRCRAVWRRKRRPVPAAED